MWIIRLVVQSFAIPNKLLTKTICNRIRTVNNISMTTALNVFKLLKLIGG